MNPSWGLQPGDLITTELTAVRRLGGGNAYEAWLAFDEVTYGPVVVKLVRPDQTSSGSTLRGLRREIEGLTTLPHPALVRALRWQTDGPRPHLVLESLDGPRLSTLIRRHGVLQPQQYLAMGIEIASALHFMGRGGWVHLDVKPSNIVMGAPAKLIDLSVARTVEAAARLDHMVGTDQYAAPEQCVPAEQFGAPSPASDIWGLGATLVHAITGVRPFEEGDPESPLADQRHRQLVDEAVLPSGIQAPAALTQLLAAMLDPVQSERPTASEAAEVMMGLLENLPVATLAGFRAS